MCGITGFADHSASGSESILNNMVRSLHHRGPDDYGSALLTSPSAQVGLGHVRLSVIDLSMAGHQPMHYRNLTLVYNGEIYNYNEIKKELVTAGHQFGSNSDTEVVLHAFEKWGVKCVDRFIGMFSFVLFDSEKDTLYAFRDRVGVKPFYYHHNEGLFLFGSELKAFHKHPQFDNVIDPSALSTYFDLGYIPAPSCIFQNTYKLRPGNYLIYDLKKRELTTHCYWDATSFYQKEKLTISFQEAKEELHHLLHSACQYRMVSDVPVGVFLSGGYDSTLVAALLQNGLTNKLKTFTIGFESGNNEAPFARETAAYLGTEHYEYICTTKEAQEIIPTLADSYDEPFADSSSIPTVLVSRFAKEHVTVALSADGGDEVFGGYTRYNRWLNHLELIGKVPGLLQLPIGKLANMGSALIPMDLVHRRHQLQGFAEVISQKESQRGQKLYHWMHLMPEKYHSGLLKNSILRKETFFDTNHDLEDDQEHPLLVDYLSYLPDDILVKVDRASMSVSLEGREPLLDHRILEFAAGLPFNYKMKGGVGKSILKEIVHDYVPNEMLNRPKAGFRIPLSEWFRGDLKPILMDTLSENSVKETQMLNWQFVNNRLKDFDKGRLHYTPLIWKLLIFQLWWNRWMKT